MNFCNRGLVDNAFGWITIHGLATHESYGSYWNKDGYCHYNDSTIIIGAKLSGYVRIRKYDKIALKKALVHHGPVAVSVDGSFYNLYFFVTLNFCLQIIFRSILKGASLIATKFFF